MSALDRFQPLADRARDQLAAMSPRDRKLLLGLGIGGALLVVFGGIFLMKGALDAREAKVADRQETLRRVHLLAADFADSQAQAEQIEAKIAEHAGTDMSAYLEQVASRTNVGDRLDAVRQKATSEEGTLQETIYAVSLSKLGQSELATFLYELESTGYPLQVRTMTVKSRRRADEVTLNVDLDIAAYKLISATEED